MAFHRIPSRSIFALTILFAAAALAVSAAAAEAQPGALDSTFGSGGVVFSDPYGAARSAVYDVKTQPDGKVVALETNIVTKATYVLRYLADGAPDPAFGQQGIVTLPSALKPYALALQPDGRVLVGGSASPGYFAVARLLTTGELDHDFDGDIGNANGLVTTQLSAAGPGNGHAITVDSKNRIVLAGTQNASTKSYFAIARYQPDGKLDQTFNNGGRLVDPGSGADSIWTVTTQADGKIVAAGDTGTYPNGDTLVARYNEDGTPDAGFGSGRTQIDIGGYDTAVAVAPQPGNQVLVASKSYTADDRLIRLGADGKEDASYAGNGPLGLKIKSMALAPDGKIVLGGWLLDGTDACVLTRRNADGSPDTSFANGGPVVSRPAPNTTCIVEVAAVAPDGKIVAGEHTGDYPHERAAIARYLVDPDPVGGTPGGSDGTAAGEAGPPPASPAQDRLTLSGLKVTNRRFIVKRAVTTPRVGQARPARRVKRGTAFAFALNRDAAVAIRIDRLVKGRKARVVARLKRTAGAGANRVSFSGRVGRRLLRPGSYRARFSAVDTTGNRSTPQAVKFRIVRG
jgi:uncharacterized delta-60 repeat protein